MNAQYLPSTFDGRMARLTEECGEVMTEIAKVLQSVGKIGRFGVHSRPPKGGPTNAEQLLSELSDLKDAIIRLEPDLLDALSTERL